MRGTRTVRWIALAAMSAFVLASCAGDDTDPATDTAADATAEEADGTDDAGQDDAGAGDAEQDGTEQDAGQSGPVSVEHAQGETTVDERPERVVVLDPGALDTLDAMEVEVVGVPEMPNLPDHLSQYGDGQVQTVGTLFEPDYEQINALEPDLIVVGLRSSPAYEDLSELAPTIDLTLDNSDVIGSFSEQFTQLGELFGQQDEVAQRIDELETAIAEVEQLAQDAGTGLIVMTSGGEVTAYGPGSRFGLIHDVLGVAPAVEDVEDATHGDAVSFEFILEAAPDHLFVLDRDSTIGESGDAAEVVLDNELVAQTPAWSEGNVHYLDGTTWYLSPNGLRSIESMIGEVRAALS